MAHEDTPEQQAQQQEQQTTVDAAATGTTTTPTDEEVGLAVLDAARYGDLEDLQELAKAYGGRHLGYQQEGAQGGNTALHYACANGHVECAAWLLEQGVEGSPANDSGNTPLHWAVQNQHPEAVRLLLEKLGDGADVLRRNGFGKSALTEGFGGQDQAILTLLLEHSSAEEEKLLMGKKGEEQEGQEEEGEGMVHALVLDPEGAPDRVLNVRELAIKHADDPFGQEAADDTTGLGIWCAALVLARWLASDAAVQALLEGSVVCELGAGCGVPGLAAALHGRPREVFLTDLNPETVANLRANIALNHERLPDPALPVQALAMDWADASSYPPSPVDVVLGSDLVYQKSIAPLLSQVLGQLLRPGGRFLYVAPSTGRDGLPEFLSGLGERAGLKLVGEKAAPPALLGNPLASGSDDDFLLHFHELATGEHEYRLYDFVKEE